MVEILNHPVFQGAIAPFLVALIVGLAFARTRFAWLAVIAAYATMIVLDQGFSIIPPTVARKTMLVGLLSPLAGVVADAFPQRSGRIAAALVAATGLLSIWVFVTALQNRGGAEAIIAGAGIALFVAALIAAMLRLRDDGLRCGAAGLGLGIAVGVAGVLSASIGALVDGAAIAAGCAAMLIVQIVLSRPPSAGFVGALPIGLLTALIAAGTQQLALLPWYALPLFLLIPFAVVLPAPTHGPTIGRVAAHAGYALAAAAVPIGVALYAARGKLF